jgi:predicted RNase H-like nuclease
MQQGIFCFSSTTREKAVSHSTDYYGWMLRGEELYQALELTHPIGSGPGGRFCFETFPHAITWQLRGGAANAKRKRAERAELLSKIGIYFKDRVGIDTMDAALCAYMAHLVAAGMDRLSLGEPQTGYIVIPALGQ